MSDDIDLLDPEPEMEPEPEAQPAPSPALEAHALSLTGDRGPVFGPLDLQVARGEVAALVGPEGSGRTALLLALVGRMATTSGDLTVLGHRLPRGRREVHRRSTLANFADIDQLDEGLTVHEVLAERAAILAPLWRPAPRTDQEGVIRLCAPVFGDRPIPPADEQIWHLGALDVVLLRLTVALMGDPELLVVDDVDALSDPDHQRVVWGALARLAADRGTTIVATTTTTDAVPADATLIDLV
ncbi:ATP-binding cassette domain-containing protein [Mariniluteicoccus flavus]